MRQYKSWIAALILGSTLSTNAQQKNMENKTLNENIPEMIISLEKEALASTDPMAFVELSDTDVIYFDPSLETKIEGLEQLRTYYKGMQLPPADHFDMIRPIVQVTQNIAVLTFNLDCYLSDKVIKWNCTEVYRQPRQPMEDHTNPLVLRETDRLRLKHLPLSEPKRFAKCII